MALMKICHTCQRTYTGEIELCPHDGARLADQDAETDAQLAAGLSHRYRIIRRLGAGGMGTVFLAQQIAVGNRPVALKVLLRKLLDDPEFLLRFQDEAASTGLIHHPNVVTIYESAQADDGTPYIAMEFLQGETLREVLQRRSALPVAEAAEILLQTARGLNAAHKLGIIHRDLKPDNIFLTRSDEGEVIAKVVDFGIAKLRESATHTLTGMVIGTPAYMSFEQASGMRSNDLDARSDVYSLGVVAYEMLAGGVPFHADTPLGYVRKHMLEEPPPLRAVGQGVAIAPQVEAVVMKAMFKDRDQRYASALDFAHDFARAASAPSTTGSPEGSAPMRPELPEGAAWRPRELPGEPSSPPAAPAGRLAGIKAKRSPTGIAILVIAFGVLVVATLVWMYRRSPQNPIHQAVPGARMNTPKPNPDLSNRQPQEQLRPSPPAQEIPTPANDAAALRRKVDAAITEGDSYYDDGKYDLAIAAYKTALAVDAGNAQLLQKVQRAQAAQAAERSVPH